MRTHPLNAPRSSPIPYDVGRAATAGGGRKRISRELSSPQESYVFSRHYQSVRRRVSTTEGIRLSSLYRRADDVKEWRAGCSMEPPDEGVPFAVGYSDASEA